MKRFITSILILTGVIGAGIGIWLMVDQKARAEKLEAEILKGLSAEELTLVLRNEAIADHNSVKTLKDDAKRRQLFIKGLKETLALAAQARREGFAEKDSFKVNLDYKKNILLADLYIMKLSEGKDRLYVVPQNEIDAIWQNPSHEKIFQRDMKTLREIRIAGESARGNQTNIPELRGESLANAKGKWARTKILSDKAKADKAFMSQAAIPLRFKIIEAGILSNDYLVANIGEHLRAKDTEIAAYLKQHPEYDVKKKLEQAELLLNKAKSGEDLAKLAKEYSEDRLTSDKGGLYEDIGTNVVWKEVEDVALQLKPNEIADRIIETDLGYHIVQLVKKNNYTQTDRTDLKFSIRHIVLQKKFEDPNERLPGVPPPYLSAAEIAKMQVEKTKRDQFVAKILQQNPVSLPADFTVELPEVKSIEANNNSQNTK